MKEKGDQEKENKERKKERKESQQASSIIPLLVAID
jgi:hypothetical protein